MPGSSHADVGVTQAVADIGRGVDALERLLAMQRETIGLLGSQLDARTRAVLEPLVTELSLVRQSNEPQARQLIDQAETIGRQGAELEAERERGKMYHAEAERARDELATAETFRRRNSRRLAIALVVAATLAIVAVLAPAAGMVAR